MEHVVTDAQTGKVTVVPFTTDEIADYSARIQAQAWGVLRARRDELLAASDIYVVADRWHGYSDEQKAAWANYRQALRDLPSLTADPLNPAWPSQPE